MTVSLCLAVDTSVLSPWKATV